VQYPSIDFLYRWALRFLGGRLGNRKMPTSPRQGPTITPLESVGLNLMTPVMLRSTILFWALRVCSIQDLQHLDIPIATVKKFYCHEFIFLHQQPQHSTLRECFACITTDSIPASQSGTQEQHSGWFLRSVCAYWIRTALLFCGFHEGVPWA